MSKLYALSGGDDPDWAYRRAMKEDSDQADGPYSSKASRDDKRHNFCRHCQVTNTNSVGSIVLHFELLWVAVSLRQDLHLRMMLIEYVSHLSSNYIQSLHNLPSRSAWNALQNFRAKLRALVWAQIHPRLLHYLHRLQPQPQRPHQNRSPFHVQLLLQCLLHQCRVHQLLRLPVQPQDWWRRNLSLQSLTCHHGNTKHWVVSWNWRLTYCELCFGFNLLLTKCFHPRWRHTGKCGWR